MLHAHCFVDNVTLLCYPSLIFKNSIFDNTTSLFLSSYLRINLEKSGFLIKMLCFW